jgi:hypothetical protein
MEKLPSAFSQGVCHQMKTAKKQRDELRVVD